MDRRFCAVARAFAEVVQDHVDEGRGKASQSGLQKRLFDNIFMAHLNTFR